MPPLSQRSPAILLALALAAVVLAVPRFGDPRPWVLEAKWALLILTLGGSAVWALRSGRGLPRPDTAAAWLAWALAGTHALSALARGPGEAEVFRTGGLAALALALTWASRLPAGDAGVLLGTLAALGGLTGFLVTCQRLGWDALGLDAAACGPGAATFDHKGLAAAFLSISLPVSLALALRSSGRRRASALSALACAATGLLLGETRAAWLAGAAGVATFLGLLAARPRSLAWGALALGLPVAAVALANPGLGGRLWDRATSIVRNRDPRLLLWEASWTAWKERPLLGHGPARYAEAVAPPAARALSEAQIDSFSAFAHNDLLQVGVETGWLGAGILLALAWALARGLARASPGASPIRAALGGALAAGAVNVFLCFPLYDPGCALALALLAGLSAGLGRRPAQTRSSGCRPWLAGLAAAGVLLSLRLPLAKALAGAHLAEAARLAPQTVPLVLRHADRALPDAAEAARRALPARRAHPTDGEVWIHLGKLSLFQRRPAEALQHFNRAARLAPWMVDARVGQAYALFQGGNPEAAYALLDHCALRAFPSEFTGFFYFLKGSLLLQEGRNLPLVLSHLRQALAEQDLHGRPDTFSRKDCEAVIADCEARMRHMRR